LFDLASKAIHLPVDAPIQPAAEAIKVVIVNEEGQYIAGSAHCWEFTEDRARAKVFDYVADHVAEQIKLVRNTQGIVWIAVRLDPSEVFEFCDRCGSRVAPADAFYSGKEFLCRTCRPKS